jgi:polysaccharide biosynthesis protein PelE
MSSTAPLSDAAPFSAALLSSHAVLLAYGAPLALDAGATALVIAGRASAGAGLHAVAAALAFGLTAHGLHPERGAARRSPAVAPSAAAASPTAASVAAWSAAVLVLTLPVVGAALLALVVWPSWRRRPESAGAALVEVALPDGSGDIDEPPLARAPAARPIRELLRNATSADERVRAVMALRHMDARRAVPLLRLAFSHESEDVRLLAFGILEQREKRLRSRIELNQSRLASASCPQSVPGSPRPRCAGEGHGEPGQMGTSAFGACSTSGEASSPARWHRRLARDHWELVYGGFVSGDLEPAVLAQARDHAQAALAREPDAKMAVLLARIYLRRRQPEAAEAYLARAQRAGLPAASAAPLLAEAAFQRRRFGEIATILRGVQRAELRRPELEPVAEYWTSEP